MFIFLYGEDSYSSLKKFREIIEHYKKSHKTGLNFKDYDCENSDFTEIERLLIDIANSAWRRIRLLA